MKTFVEHGQVGGDATLPVRRAELAASALRTVSHPYIAAAAAEQPEPVSLVLLPGFILGLPDLILGFPDEHEDDRDSEGGLWVRVPDAPDVGEQIDNWRPHPRRQRDLMRGLRCQVCKGPAARNTERAYLFLLPDGPQGPTAGDPRWAENLLEATPPICLEHAEPSAERCPRLGNVTALWVGQPILHGVYGTTYALGPTGIEKRGAGIVEYETPALGWVVATQMVRELKDVTVDWDMTLHLRALHSRRQTHATLRCPRRAPQ